jgi:hypothetical protein
MTKEYLTCLPLDQITESDVPHTVSDGLEGGMGGDGTIRHQLVRRKSESLVHGLVLILR